MFSDETIDYPRIWDEVIWSRDCTPFLNKFKPQLSSTKFPLDVIVLLLEKNMPQIKFNYGDILLAKKPLTIVTC